MNLYCVATGRHRWSRAADEIPESAAFVRIDCLRRGCGYSVDGVLVRMMKVFLRDRGLLTRSVEKRLP